MGRPRGLRPLTLFERHGTWIYGLMPCIFIYMLLQLFTSFLTLVNADVFAFLDELPTLDVALPFTDYEFPLVDLHTFLSRFFYIVAYLLWGRSTGHLLVGAYIVDRNTMRRIGAGQRLLRGLFQVAITPVYLLVDLLSLGLILTDKEQRRSVNDWVAGTLVVIGDIPEEPERVSWRQRLNQLSRALRPRPAATEPA